MDVIRHQAPSQNPEGVFAKQLKIAVCNPPSRRIESSEWSIDRAAHRTTIEV